MAARPRRRRRRRPYLGLTPLHFAVAGRHVDTARLLLERGADPTLRDRIHDGTPLGWARQLGDRALQALLAAPPPSRLAAIRASLEAARAAWGERGEATIDLD